MSEPSAEVRTLRFFYTTFWKLIFLVASLLMMAIGILVLKWLSPEPPFYVGVLVVLVAVSIAYVAVEVFGRGSAATRGRSSHFMNVAPCSSSAAMGWCWP